MSSPVLTAKRICKSYGIPVLEDVDLDVQPGEVHAVVGENGAGKSTLARVISGITQPDSGVMHLAGHRFSPRRRSDARDAGIGFVMQELNLIRSSSVAESLFLDTLPNRWGVIDRQRLNESASKVLALVGLGGLEIGRAHV